MSLFQTAIGQAQTLTGQLVSLVGEQVNTAPRVGAIALSTESRNDADNRLLSTTLQDIQAGLKSICAEHQITPSAASINAATAAAVIGSDWKKALTTGLRKVDSDVVHSSVGGFEKRSLAVEAYSERENQNAAQFSTVYNLLATQQSPVGELFFPTITLSPDLAGIELKIPLFQVYKGTERKLSGDFMDLKRRNLIKASVDHTILETERTRLVPVYRPENASKFVDSALIAPTTYDKDGEIIPTAPLAINTDVELISLGATDAILASGVMNQTDTLEPGLYVKAVYVKFGDDIIKFNTRVLSTFNFLRSSQGMQRSMTLTASTNSLLINKATKTASGGALTSLAGVVTDDLVVRVDLKLSGQFALDTGNGKVFGNSVSTYTVSKAKNLLDQASAPAKAVADVINDGVILGYEMDAWLSNENRRQQGQLVDTNYWRESYLVQYRSPISTMYPTTESDQRDAADVQTLIATTRTRLENEAITKIFETAEILSQYHDARDALDVSPDIFGLGRHFVRPYFYYEKLDMATIVDTVKSQEKKKDIQEALLAKMRDAVYRAFQASDFAPSLDILSGGIGATPEVQIATDQILVRYIMQDGDVRTLGGKFDFRIATTNDQRFHGKIVMTFGIFDSNRNVAVHPLNFGNLLWAPELTLSAAITRDGQISRETMVMPRYEFMINCPIMIVFDVEGVEDVLNKMPLNIHQV